MAWQTPKVRPLERGKATNQKKYFVHILRALVRNGGQCSTKRMYDEVAGQMTFNEYDNLRLDNGEIRWRESMRAARKILEVCGLLCPKEVSGRANWRITERGRLYLRWIDAGCPWKHTVILSYVRDFHPPFPSWK